MAYIPSYEEIRNEMVAFAEDYAAITGRQDPAYVFNKLYCKIMPEICQHLEKHMQAKKEGSDFYQALEYGLCLGKISVLTQIASVLHLNETFNEMISVL